MNRYIFGFLAFYLSSLVMASEPWPGEAWWESENLTSLDNDFVNNLSGAHWNPETRTLWVCINGPAKFWAITQDGSGNWGINYQDGVKGQFVVSGDLEGITQVDLSEPTVYLIDESADTILKYDVSDYSNPTLIASWNISAYVPSGGGAGSEGITFVPDSWLAKNNFVDANGNAYTSKNGMGGLMFIAHQNGGKVYVFDLAIAGTGVDFVGSYVTSRTESAGLEFDRSTGYLFIWHNIDSNYLEVSDLSSYYQGGGERRLTRLVQYVSPKTGNLEGVALTPADAGENRLFFTDDDNQDGYALMAYSNFNPPLGVPDAYQVNEDGTLVLPAPGVLANDYSGDTATLVSAPINGDILGLFVGESFDGGFIYQPDNGFSGKDAFSYTIDGVQITQVTITVNAAPPEPPAPPAEIEQTGATTPTLLVLMGLLLLVRIPLGQRRIFYPSA